MSFKRVIQRPGYQRHVEFDGRYLKGHTVQHNRNAIMDQNAELRKARGAIRNMEGMRLALDIPIADLQVIEKFYPGISNPGHPDYKWQVRRFLQSPASAPYRVEDFRRKQVNAGNIIVKS